MTAQEPDKMQGLLQLDLGLLPKRQSISFQEEKN
jgi:hypothetical protein